MAVNATLLQEARDKLRVRNYTVKTEKAYLYWVECFLGFYEEHDPMGLSLQDVEAFVQYLSKERYTPEKTRNQALHALLFLYKDVLGREAGWLEEYVRRQLGVRNHNFLKPVECQRLLSNMFGQEWLIASIVYGSGLRLMECVRLRVRDINFQDKALVVRQPNGEIGRLTLLPEKLISPLKNHFEDRKLLHIKDIADGFGEAYLPAKIAREYPDAARSWGWQYVFPSGQRMSDPRHGGGRLQRHHRNESSVKEAVERAAVESGVYQNTSADTLRNSFAVHLIQRGVDTKVVEALLGHGENAHLTSGHLTTCSPLDLLTTH